MYRGPGPKRAPSIFRPEGCAGSGKSVLSGCISDLSESDGVEFSISLTWPRGMPLPRPGARVGDEEAVARAHAEESQDWYEQGTAWGVIFGFLFLELV